MVEVISDLDHALTTVRQDTITQPSRTDLVQEELILFGVFISANMIHPHDKPVEFELSIGQLIQ